MIEPPEAVVLAQQINQTLTGKQIKRATANQSPHKFAWYTGDPARYNELLAGKTIRAASYFASIVDIKADDMILGLSVLLRYHPAGDKLPKKHQLLLEFADNTALSATVQMWGGLFCFKETEKGGFKDTDMARQKPSPLSDAFDRAYFGGLFDENTGKLTAKAFLATEQRIPGLGNGVLQDILWTARIHPRRRMADLSRSEIGAMYRAVKSVLKKMSAQGGRDTERDLFGFPGGYTTVLSKNTVGKPCPECGALIQKEAYLGGSIYYCPGCQPI
ncbi:MAG: endonuclease VIII [Chloroflexi bacterium]|nr:endonuclease VIII [Chloroflexota bacterium]